MNASSTFGFERALTPRISRVERRSHPGFGDLVLHLASRRMGLESCSSEASVPGGSRMSSALASTCSITICHAFHDSSSASFFRHRVFYREPALHVCRE